MPACIVLVHDDPGFANPALAALRAAGYDAVGFQDSMSAIDALEHPKRIELLITRVRYPSGTPNGVALACMARLKRPGIKVLFASFPEVRQHTDGIGEFLPRPLSSDELLETVARMLNNHPIRLPRRLSPVQAQNAEMARHRPSIGSCEAASRSIGSNDSVSVACLSPSRSSR
jgi:DNA-binding NtrC family response regulator